MKKEGDLKGTRGRIKGLPVELVFNPFSGASLDGALPGPSTIPVDSVDGDPAATPGTPPVQRSSLKATMKRYVTAFGNAPFIAPVVHHPGVRRILSPLPGARALYGSRWDRKHPYDRENGTDTSGFVPMEQLVTGNPADSHGSPYAGVQPSVLRTVLATLPNLDQCTFIDLGCGKGRPLLIATEFPFKDILGVELCPHLAEAAHSNACVMAAQHPERTRIRVEVGDATSFPLPEGDLALFIYNSFDRELMEKLAARVDGALMIGGERTIYVIYCNPASGACFDASPLLKRRWAQTLPYTAEEKEFAEDKQDAVIIWENDNAPTPDDAEIVVVKERWRAEIQFRPHSARTEELTTRG